jgi:hypothetical protein
VTIRPRAGRRPQVKVERVSFKEEESSSLGFIALDQSASSARSARGSKGLLASVRLKERHSECR